MTLANTISSAASGSASAGIRALARFGFAAKGVVYLLMGTLALLAATGQQGGQTADKKQAVQSIQSLPGGQILLGLIAVGLLGYIIWRFTQAFRDTENKGNGAKGIGRRIGYAGSGLLYASVAWYAAKLAFTGSASSGGSTQQSLVAKVLGWPGGEWIVILIGLITIGSGLYQIYRAYSGAFHKHVNDSGLPASQQQLVYRTGQLGYTARGIVMAIIGYFFVQAGRHHQAADVGTTDEAFDLLAAMGPFALGIVALGLMAYGVYMLVQAKYPVIRGV
ncbi:DUF1206 domain-containing protein [Hymenobacter lutimineralis]|uniref:DUF1206 domain-containing protein n=1 Tax=Hymenobacter lutimineralis TaxID=2606448 RepID=A0A5D6UYQ9_9BACT|nr:MULTISPECIES: DUF1206 domain-containing protein [Hymenobacter]QIX61376.1 DUF1206 domain-containing protein [Hymenobacter sp. BT18]TYZ08921.1 DUF1206 domain-containing protein [Hymenobacter lutimineralis]